MAARSRWLPGPPPAEPGSSRDTSPCDRERPRSEKIVLQDACVAHTPQAEVERADGGVAEHVEREVEGRMLLGEAVGEAGEGAVFEFVQRKLDARLGRGGVRAEQAEGWAERVEVASKLVGAEDHL